MSKIHRVDQGTTEWHLLRIGKPTASMFHKIITPGGKPSSQARDYMFRLIAERLLNEQMEDGVGRLEWIERGKVREPDAAAQLSFTHNLDLEPVGFVTDDDNRLGCSPDRLVVGRREAVEIKCPAPWTQIGYMLDGPGNDYRPQVQGQLLIGEFDRVHFYSWHDRMPPVYAITGRDEKYIAVLGDLLERFVDELDAETLRARRMGSFAAIVREHGIVNPLMAG
jgi:hypothetical protein